MTEKTLPHVVITLRIPPRLHRAVKELAHRTRLSMNEVCNDLLTTACQRDHSARAILEGKPVCRVCGCTDEHACPGGCYWVEPDLCSACADAQLPTLRSLRGMLKDVEGPITFDTGDGN